MAGRLWATGIRQHTIEKALHAHVRVNTYRKIAVAIDEYKRQKSKSEMQFELTQATPQKISELPLGSLSETAIFRQTSIASGLPTTCPALVRQRMGWVVTVRFPRNAISTVNGNGVRKKICNALLSRFTEESLSHAAELNIRRRGLDIASMAEVETAGGPVDQVVGQNPTANAAQLVAPKINLLVSRGSDPPAYVMPSFVGQPLGSVNRTLQDAGFRLGNVSVASIVEVPADQSTEAGPTLPVEPSPASIIVSQTPAAGQKVVAGTTVSFEVR